MDESTHRDIFHDWLKRHRGIIFKVLRSFARDPRDRQDLFQEIALQLWRSIPRYGGECAETTWVYRVAFYCASSWSQREKPSRDRLESQLLVMQPEVEEDPRIDWLYDQIRSLGELDRSLALLLLEGFTYREMAEVLGLSESLVGVRIHRIKKTLAGNVERE